MIQSLAAAEQTDLRAHAGEGKERGQEHDAHDVLERSVSSRATRLSCGDDRAEQERAEDPRGCR